MEDQIEAYLYHTFLMYIIMYSMYVIQSIQCVQFDIEYMWPM